MKYFLTHVHTADATWEPGAEERLAAWVREMENRGIVLDGDRLADAATTVRRQGDDVTVLDGPYAETKEQIAGYDLIECTDLDEAIAVASAHPTLEAGAIEVRPVAPGMPTPSPRQPRRGARRYVMFVCWDQTGDGEIPDGVDDEDDDPMAEWIEETGERRLHGWQLQPPSMATTVRAIDGKVTVLDGPFAETKEQIGGYDLLECADLDEAIAIATAHGMSLLDLRPVLR